MSGFDIEKFKEAAKKNNLPDSEVDALLNQSKYLVGYQIWLYLKYIINVEFPDIAAPAAPAVSNADQSSDVKSAENTQKKELLDLLDKFDIDRSPNRKVGEFSINMPEDKNVIMCLSMGVVKKDDSLDIRFPITMPIEKQKKAFSNILGQVDRLASTTHAYYKLLMAENPEFFRKLAIYIPKIDFSDLMINQHTRYMTFHEKYDLRLGVVIFYRDRQGRVYTDGKNQDKGEKTKV